MADDVVGRGAERAAVEPFLDRASAGLAALVLDGEAGIGKSTIWRLAIEAARNRGWLVLTSSPTRAEQSLTLGGLVDLLDPVDGAAFAALPPPQRHALEVALLRVDPTGVAPDQRTLSVATAALLRQLATADRPVLVAIDDAQWLDESASAIVAYALRRLGERPLGLLAAVRSGAETAASDGLLAAVPDARTERTRLEPMRLAALHRLFELRLGRSFPRLVLARISAASGGNPLYALEIGRALLHAGALADARDPLPVPDTLASLIATRVSRLPAATRHAMLLAAAASEPALPALDHALPGFEERIRPAVDDGLVVVGGRSVEFTHPLFAQAVTSLASPDDLRDAHRALAAVTESPDARARHLARAADAPGEHVAEALERAADEARRRGATLDAAGLYQEAARLTPAAGTDALRRSLCAAECLFIDLSEIVEADRILAAAIDAAPPAAGLADALSLRAIIRYYHGQVPEAIALGERALAAAGDESIGRARVLGRLAYLVMQLDLARGVSLVDEAVTLLDAEAAAGRDVDPDLVANALLLRSVAELGLVRPTRGRDIERGLRLMSVDGRSWEREGADGSAFGLARHTDDLDRAISMTRELVRAKSGPSGDDPFNLVMLSGLLVLHGEWPEARQVAEAAMDGYAREGAEVHPAWGLRGLALVAAHDGRLDDARRWAEEGLRRATERGDAVMTIFHRHILGFVALTTGAWAEADVHLTAAASTAERVATRHPGRFKLAGDQVEAALALGDAGRAAAIVERLQEAARIAPTPWVLAVGARAAGLVEAANGQSDAAVAHLERALTEHERLPMPFERARTLLAKGGVHRRRREKRLADEALHAALATFESLGAPHWAERAREELARVGRRPRAPEALTGTERHVAELAASGLSNREVAERAFLAPKTVGNVLERVYQKLGIHSRAELGAWMAAGEQAPSAD